MITFCVVFFLIVAIQGGGCIQFLVQGNDGVTCMLDFRVHGATKGRSQPRLADKKCSTVGNHNFLNFDYHFSQKYMYYFDDEEDNFQITGSTLSFSLEKTTSKVPINSIKIVTKFAVDWIHDTFYIVSSNLMIGSYLQSDLGIPLETIITRQDLIALTNETQMFIMDVHVDPYKQKLFLLTSAARKFESESPEKIYLVSSDLKGKNLKIVIYRPYVIDDVNFHVDVSDMKLYLCYRNRLYIFSYEGRPKRFFALPNAPTAMSVFGNSVYFVRNPGVLIYEVSLTQSDTNATVTRVYNPQMEVDEIKFRVLDIGVQRQKRNGKFICDRTDCPYLCEVRPTGDTCTCRETDAKSRDGVTCYSCGRSNLTSAVQQPTIVDGEVSYPGNFPWHTVLYSTVDWQAFCGGSLITSTVVLTAAHCVTSPCETCRPPPVKPEDINVALGKTFRPWNITEPATIKSQVTRVLVNEDYMGPSLNYAHDIALLFLKVKIKTHNLVMPACLDYNLNQLPMNTNFTGYVAGFGYTEECGGVCSSPSDRLQYTTAPVMSFSDCYKASNMLHSSTFHKLTSDKICIGNGSVSAVQQGDSGGGLTLTHRGLHYVVGVVSHKLMKVNGFDLNYSFGAFTNVNEYMDWIKQNLPLTD